MGVVWLRVDQVAACCPLLPPVAANVQKYNPAKTSLVEEHNQSAYVALHQL